MRSVRLARFLIQQALVPYQKDPIAENKEVLVALLQIIHAAKNLDRSAFPNGIAVENVSLELDGKNTVAAAVVGIQNTNTTQQTPRDASAVVSPLNKIILAFINGLVKEKEKQNVHWLRKFLLTDNTTAQERQITGAYLQLMLVHFLWQHHVKGTQAVKDFSDHLAKENFPITTQASVEYIYQLMRMPGVTPCTFGKAWIDIISTIEKYSKSQDKALRNAAGACIEFLDSELIMPAVYTAAEWKTTRETSEKHLGLKNPTQSNNGSRLFDMARATAAATHHDPTVAQPQRPATDSTAATPIIGG